MQRLWPVKMPLVTMLMTLALASCSNPAATTSPSGSGSPSGFGTSGPGPSGPDSSTSTPVSSPVTTTPAGGCGAGEPLVAEGAVANIDQSASDAEQIGAITWETNEECEIFVIDFVTAEGAPATTPPSIDGTFLREVGILRVGVQVEMTAITDQLVQSALVERLYVARKSDRTLFIDFHMAGAAVARISVGSSPGQLLVELEAGGDGYPAAPAIAENIVLVSPVEGAVENPVALSGYSRNFEANTVGRITQGDIVLAEGFTTAADWSETWGEFSLELNATGSGEADLFAGEQSAQDGSDRGVVLTIDLP